MSQINPYYQFRVIKLLYKAVPIPMSEEDKQKLNADELFQIFTDGVLAEVSDAAGTVHKFVLHRAAFPMSKGVPDEVNLQPGVEGYLQIESVGNLCVDLSDFLKE